MAGSGVAPNRLAVRPMLLERSIGRLRQRVVPIRWSHVFGVISMAAMVVLLVTGIYLTFFYEPSGPHVTYDGDYAPLRGVEMSPAYESTLRLSSEVRGGLLVRQTHHWAALVLPASLMLQLFSIFLAGAFRRPRRGMWLLLFATFTLALVGGWSGYALPDDSLSGTGLRIMHGMVMGIPVIGSTLAFLLFGGEFPGRILEVLYPLHVFVVPLLLVGVVALRLRLAFRRGPMREPPARGEGADGTRATSLRATAMRYAGMFVIFSAVLVGMGATLTISPIWRYGPANAANASNGSQPDWYLGFLDGALRLVPPGWEVVLWDRTWPLALLVPMAVVSAFMMVVASYPFIESRLSRDRDEHHVLERARDNPTRTGVGAAGAVFYAVLLFSGGVDVIGTQLHLSFESLIYVFRAGIVLGPVLAFVVARGVCLDLQRRERQEQTVGLETGQVMRALDGGYAELHAPLPSRGARPTPRGRAASEDDAA